MIFAFDLETFLIQPGKHVPQGVCFSWSTGSTEYGIAHLNPRFGEREQVRDRFYAALTQAEAIVGANVAFDMAVMGREFPEIWPAIWSAYRDDRVLDIELNEKLIAIAKGELKFRWAEHPDGTKVLVKRKYDLATLVREHLGESLDKDTWRLKYGTLYETPISEWAPGAVEYSLCDALGTWKVLESQRKHARYLKDAYRQARAGWWLYLMSAHGFRVDGRAVAALERATREEMHKKISLLAAYGMVKPNGSRDTKVAAARMETVCAARKVAPPTTPTGKVRLSEEVCLETGDSALIAYAEYTSLSNVIKKDVVALKAAAEAGVPVQSRFDVLKATGRTGSSGGKLKKGQDRTAYGFQLQNVRRDPRPNPDGSYPPTVRGCFIPRPGYLLCSIDYGQMELHAWAQVCRDLLGFSDLATMLNAGIDVHCKLGAMAIGRTYEEVFANRKKETWAKDARQLAKCFHPDTEVLTKTGWVKVSELTLGTEVAAAQVRDGGAVEIVWEQPTRLTKRHAEELIHLKNKGIDLRVTPDHRMVGWGQDTQGAKARRALGEVVEARLGSVVTCNPENFHKVRAWPSAGVCRTGVDLEAERLLRLAVATQADGSYQQRYIRFGFYKQRKINRLTALLREGEYERTEHKNGKNRPTQVFRLSDELSAQIRSLLDEKKFPWWWLNLSERDRNIVLDEAAHWDSHVDRHARQFQYCSSIKQNIDVLQAIASITGRKSRVRQERETSEDGVVNASWTLSVKDHHTTRGGALKTRRVPYHGDVYCLTVPSDAVLVRDGGIPVISRQCGNFGFPGGLGAGRFKAYAKASWGVEISEQKAIELYALWKKMLREAGPYFDLVKSQVDVSGDQQIVQVRSGRVRGDVGFTDGANGYFQGLAADCSKDAGFNIAEAMYLDTSSPAYGSRLVDFVHDEFLFEVPADRPHEAAFAVNKIVEAAGRRWMPDCPPKSEPALMERWYKDAEARYENGRLAVWRPKKPGLMEGCE